MSVDSCINCGQYTRCGDLMSCGQSSKSIITSSGHIRWHSFHVWLQATYCRIIYASMIPWPNGMGHERRLMYQLWSIYSVRGSDELWVNSTAPHQGTYDGIASVYGSKRHIVIYASMMPWPNGMGHERRLMYQLWSIYSMWGSDELWVNSTAPHQDTYANPQHFL